MSIRDEEFFFSYRIKMIRQYLNELETGLQRQPVFNMDYIDNLSSEHFRVLVKYVMSRMNSDSLKGKSL